MGSINRWNNTILGFIIGAAVNVPLIPFANNILDHPNIDEFIGLSVVVKLSVLYFTFLGGICGYNFGTSH